MNWISSALSFYLASLNGAVDSYMASTKKKNRISYIETVIRFNAVIWLFYQLVFVGVELLIWGETFPHYGDVILHVWLVVRMSCMTYLIVKYGEDNRRPMVTFGF